MEGTVQLINY